VEAKGYSGGRLTLRLTGTAPYIGCGGAAIGSPPVSLARLLTAMRSCALLFLAMALALGHSASAQTWDTGYFNTTNGYGPANSSLSGAPTNVAGGFQWQTTDPKEVNGMFRQAGWTLGAFNSGNKSALFGGYNAASGSNNWPGVTNPVLYRSFSNPATQTSPVIVVSLDFGILPSGGSFTNRDNFGFEFLKSSSSLSLAEFVLNPSASTETNRLRLQWISNGTNVVSDGLTFQSYDLQYTALYRMTAYISGNSFGMSLFGLATQTNGVGTITNFAVTSSNWVVKNGLLSGSGTAQDFDRFALNWDLASGDTNAPGGNYMNLNTVSVATAVPEPSTLALFAVASAALGLWHLRRRG